MKPQYLTIRMKAYTLYFHFFGTVNFALQDYSADENQSVIIHVLPSDTVYLSIFFKMKFGILV